MLDGQDTPEADLDEPVGLGVRCNVHAVPSQDSASTFQSATVPTASHADAEAHDTPSRSAPEAFGVGCTVHAVPSQASASDTVPLPGAERIPTAVHAIGAEHDTPLRASPTAAGVGWIVQAVPSQPSANDVVVCGSLLVKYEPTAVRRLLEVQDTPVRKWEVVPAGRGMGWAVHAVPSHRSTVEPTAVQALIDVHETAPNLP